MIDSEPLSIRAYLLIKNSFPDLSSQRNFARKISPKFDNLLSGKHLGTTTFEYKSADLISILDDLRSLGLIGKFKQKPNKVTVYHKKIK